MKKHIVFQMLVLAFVALNSTACRFIKPLPSVSTVPTASPGPTASPLTSGTPGPTATETPTSTPTNIPGELCPPVFVVMSGDTLLGISMRCGIPIDAIVRANNLQSEVSLTIGLPLFIPTPEPTATPTLTPTPTFTPLPTMTPTPTEPPQLGQRAPQPDL